MYNDSDIDRAVKSGILDDYSAAKFRTMVALNRNASVADDEYVPLKGGLDDLLIMVALVLLFVGVGAAAMLFLTLLPYALVYLLAPACAGLSLAALWQMNRYYALARKVMGPSILVLAAFLSLIWIAFSAAILKFLSLFGMTFFGSSFDIAATLASICTAGAAYVHWKQFHIPVTIAVIFALVVYSLFTLLSGIFWSSAALPFLLICGIAALAFALWWDISDIYRQTIRSDVAFWVHVLAALLIVHPAFYLLGALDPSPGGMTTLGVILLYALLAVVSIIINRRVFIFSGLAYLLRAMSSLGETGMDSQLTLIVATMPIGLTMLCLSSHWAKVRAYFLGKLPEKISAQLPRTDLTIAKPRPVS